LRQHPDAIERLARNSMNGRLFASVPSGATSQAKTVVPIVSSTTNVRPSSR
jgi:hypothetical protein